MNTFDFYKMHGAANDFIVVDDRTERFPCQDREWLIAIMRRHTGIGSEGVLLIQPSTTADFRMRFFNPDGGEVDMCGNGARCIARLAHERGIAPSTMTFETMAGLVGADILDADTVRLSMTPPRDWQINIELALENQSLTVHAVNTGVPHVVIEVPGVAQADLHRLGPGIRYHDAFAPAGTNVNFMEITGPQSLRLRTYERGVEAETPACGTGIVACGLIAGMTGRCVPPVEVTSAGGYRLVVNYEATGSTVRNVTLTGPAARVFQGVLSYPATP